MLTVAMAFTLMPIAASAQTYTLFLNDADGTLRENNAVGADITTAMAGEGAVVGGSAGSRTLTLTDFDFSTTATTALNVPGGTTIVLVGDNTIISTGSGSGNSAGITATGNLAINGTGSLTAMGGASTDSDSYGIYAQSSGVITINGGTINATGGDAEWESVGIHAQGNITINDGATVIAKGSESLVNGGSNSYGIRSNNGSVTITGGTVNAEGDKAGGHSYGIVANTNITISGGMVEAKGEAARFSYGILVGNGDLTISGSADVTATGGAAEYSRGIAADNNTIISGGTVTAYSSSASQMSVGIEGNQNVSISGGTVTAASGTGNAIGIWAYNGDLTISGGTVEATGETRAISSNHTGTSGDFTVPNGYSYWTGITTASDDSGELTGDGSTTVIDSSHKYAKIKTLTLPFYSISVTNPAIVNGGTHTFAGTTLGYPSITATNFTVSNTGTGNMTGLDVTLSGADAGNFTLDKTGIISTLISGGTTNFSIKPNDGLTAGTHIATVTITDPNITSYTFTIRFTVSTVGAPPVSTPPVIIGPETMTLTTGYTATSSDIFTITGTAPVTVTKTSGNDRITWNNATKRLDIAAGLPAGAYPVALRATNSATSYHTFTFTLTVEKPVYYLDIPTAFVGGTVTAKSGNTNPFLAGEGDVVTLTITPDAGYTPDEIQVYMSGSTTLIPLSGSGNTRTFIMPGTHVTVVATFRTTVGVETHCNASLQAFAQGGGLHVSGLTAGQTLSVYNIVGTSIYRSIANSDKAEVALPARGIYIVTNGKEVIKIIN